MNRFLDFFKNFGAGRLLVVFGAAIGVAATLAFTIFNAGAQPMSLLYADIPLAEAGQVTAALDAAGIKYKLSGDGAMVEVERDKVSAARVLLAQQGLPTSGSVGYEIFDQTNTLGQTQFVQNINRQRALETELARTIKSITAVNYARVQLVMPERRLFEDAAEAPSASVVVGFSRTPSPDQVRALQNLVAAATPGLTPDRVVVTDQKTGNMLAGGQGELGAQLASEQRSETERQLEDRVRALVEGVVGPGKVRVNVAAELNLARTTTQQETFDPDGQVVRSSQVSENTASQGLAANGGDVSVGGNIPGGDPAAGQGADQSNSGSTSETTNFEISKTVTTEITEPGEIKRLTVAVAVDGVTTPGADGAAGEWAPQSEEDMTKIQDLVRAAIGFNDERGDVVTVQNVRFSTPAVSDGGSVAPEGLLAGFDKNDLMRAGELLTLLIVAGLTIFFVARPLMKGLTQPGGMAMPMLAGAGPGGESFALAGGGGGQIAYDGASNVSAAIAAGPAGGSIDIARIEGQVKASAVKQVADFVERHPDESVSILRSWLHDA